MTEKSSGKKRSVGHVIYVSFAIMIVLAMLFTSYGSVFGEVAAYGSKYVSEVKVFSGSSLNDAVQKCRDAGYTAVEKNINHSDKGEIKDNGIYVVGYKTTDNPDEGITGISMLQMNSGYQDYTYGDIAERAVEKLGNVPDELEYSINEFVDNYKSRSPAALAAVDVLNCYSIPELNNKKLGDYMVSGDCTVDFVKKILVRSSTSVVSAFCNALVAGVADYGDSNWATRLASSSVKDELKNEDNNRKLDVLYKVLASELVDSLQTFSKGYHDAMERYNANGNKLALVDNDKNKVTEISEETVEDMSTGAEIESENGDAYYLYAYSVMNQYNYDSSTKLGDYIVSLGDSTYDETANLRKIYPLVDSITDGQVATMRLSGIAFSAIYLVNESGISSKAKEQIDDIKKEIKSKTGNEFMSIWTGTDQTIYNQKVAITTDAYRANSAGQIYNSLTSPDELDTFLSEAMSKLEIIMSVVGIAYGITYIAATTISYLGAFTVYSAATASIWAVCCAGIGSGVFGTIFGLLGCTVIILNYVALIAMIVIIVVLLVKYIWDLFHDDDAEDFTPIPPVLFDLADNRYVKYEAVDEGSEPANINGSNARRWNALYTTKSKYVGNPICSSQVDDLITVQYNDKTVPQGYEAVKCFGEVEAANLNANSKSDSASIYMFCKVTSTEINEGNDETSGDTAVNYLSKLSLSVESSETAAKAALTKGGYKVLDVNLTPVTASIKKYTYLGYTTTTNADDAITDIRISPRNTSSAFVFGNASYTSCGTTPTGDTLYYTSYKTAGTPVIADIAVKYSLDDIPEKYEPINMFCGGNAYNFNVGSELDNTIEVSHSSQTYEHWNDKGVYLYFLPSVSYTEGEEYISGLVLVAGNESKSISSTADDYIKALGLKKFDLSLTHAARVKLPSTSHGPVTQEHHAEDVETYIAYTTTHNPYRAIYGIKSYTSAPGNTSVPVYLGTMSGGSYAVCDVMFELPWVISKSTMDYYSRGIYATHSYQFASCSGDSTGINQDESTVELTPEDYEDVDWKSCSVRGKGIYVLGPVSGGTPLTLDDIRVTSDSNAPEGFVCIQDFKTPNRVGPNNLGYRTENSDFISSGESLTSVYIYQRQEAPVEKKYISSICVSTYTLDKATGGKTSDLSDDVKKQINLQGNEFCIQNLLSQCTDEIVQSNIAVDRSKTVYSDPGAVASSVSYIGVSRTDSESKAITGIIKYRTDSKEVPTTIQVGGVGYTKAGDMVLDPNGSYYLYYTTSAGASPGMPITSISSGSEVFETDCATVMTTTGTDVAEVKDGTKTVKEASKAVLSGDADSDVFIHVKFADTATMMSAVYIGHGKTKKEAQCNLLSLGCNICVDLDVNQNTGGEYVYIGYTKYTMRASEIRKGEAKYAVRDIVLTVGEEHHKTITVDGVEYRSALDEYTMVSGYDGSKAVSLNSGSGGEQIYMYYTTTKTKNTSSPIAHLGLACKDYSMLSDEAVQWEYVLDTDGNKVNLNEGAVSTIDGDGHIRDNRMYLYASRTDGIAKEGAAVDMSTITNDTIIYNVYMKGA